MRVVVEIALLAHEPTKMFSSEWNTLRAQFRFFAEFANGQNPPGFAARGTRRRFAARRRHFFFRRLDKNCGNVIFLDYGNLDIIAVAAAEYPQVTPQTKMSKTTRMRCKVPHCLAPIAMTKKITASMYIENECSIACDVSEREVGMRRLASKNTATNIRTVDCKHINIVFGLNCRNCFAAFFVLSSSSSSCASTSRDAIFLHNPYLCGENSTLCFFFLSQNQKKTSKKQTKTFYIAKKKT